MEETVNGACHDVGSGGTERHSLGGASTFGTKSPPSSTNPKTNLSHVLPPQIANHPVIISLIRNLEFSTQSRNERVTSFHESVSTGETEVRRVDPDILVASQTTTKQKTSNYVDITDCLNLPQTEAAKKLGIPPSTLSKRWKEAVHKRKWPWRTVCKIDKEIMTLLHNIPQGDSPQVSVEVQNRLAYLLRKRNQELSSVTVRL